MRRPGGQCAAALDPFALKIGDPLVQQTWTCKVTSTQALMVHDDDRLAVAIDA